MMAELAPENQIRTERCPDCILCHHPGTFIYRQQQDRLFGSGGLWDLKQCGNPDCGLIWLDPMPRTEDIGKAYANYYTHTAQDAPGQIGLLKRVYRLVEGGYQAKKYGYQSGSKPFVAKLMGRVLFLFPVRRSEVEKGVRFLHRVPRGRLLDVGCGSGDWLLKMRELGWDVDGVDFDENAVNVARRRGLEVRSGALEQQSFPSDTFDAVTLNHVLEHLPDPVGTVAECARVLKRGGKLVLFTPNSSGLGHRIFKANWRGLEPPRHLHIFSPHSMRNLLIRAGFSNFSVQTVNSSYVWDQSFMLRMRGLGSNCGPGTTWAARFVSPLLTRFEQGLLTVKREVGECLAVQAFKTNLY